MFMHVNSRTENYQPANQQRYPKPSALRQCPADWNCSNRKAVWSHWPDLETEASGWIAMWALFKSLHPAVWVDEVWVDEFRGLYIFVHMSYVFWLYYTNCYPIYCSSHDQPGIPPLTNKSNETRLRVVASYMPSCCLQFQHASACFSSPSQGVRITFLKFFGQEERRVWLPRPYFDLYIVYISILLNRIEPNRT